MFYKILQDIMNEKGLSIAEVARISNLSDSTVRSIINRKTKTVALEVAFKLSEGLGVSLERLNGITVNPQSLPNTLKNTDNMNHMTREEIGNILKRLRIEAGMTQKAVADIIGRKQQVIGHWETGYAQPDADTLFTLCELYNVTVDEAFGFSKKSTINEPYLSFAKKLQEDNVSIEDMEKIYELFKTFSQRADEVINKSKNL